jgi:hypothetical protein
VRFEPGQTTRTSKDGVVRTEWGFTGSVWEDHSQFADVDDVLAYRPLDDALGAQRVKWVSRSFFKQTLATVRDSRRIAGDACLVSGIYYTTLFQYGILAFGWEHFLTAAAAEPKRFAVVLDQFTELSTMNVADWVDDDCPVLFFHDDIAMTRGLVFSPDWCRRELLPRYDRILQPARDAGKKLVFVSDGNYMDLIDDLFALGVDGVMIDPTNDLRTVIDGHPDAIVIGNADTLLLTHGSPQDVRREVARCVELGKDMPGYFLKASGDLPHTIPMANIGAYFQAKAELGRR